MEQGFIFDIDSTLANVDHRMNFVILKMWQKFYNLQDKDTPIKATVSVAKALYDSGFKIFIVTGRPEKYRSTTEEWLSANNISYHKLIMRDPKEGLHDSEYKLKKLKELQNDYEILGAFEDRKHNVEIFRENGITVFDVAGNTF